MNLFDLQHANVPEEYGQPAHLLVCIDATKDFLACIRYILAQRQTSLGSLHVHLLYAVVPDPCWQVGRFYTSKESVHFQEARGTVFFEEASAPLLSKGVKVHHHFAPDSSMETLLGFAERLNCEEVIACEPKASLFSGLRFCTSAPRTARNAAGISVTTVAGSGQCAAPASRQDHCPQ